MQNSIVKLFTSIRSDSVLYFHPCLVCSRFFIICALFIKIEPNFRGWHYFLFHFIHLFICKIESFSWEITIFSIQESFVCNTYWWTTSTIVTQLIGAAQIRHKCSFLYLFDETDLYTTLFIFICAMKQLTFILEYLATCA